MKEAILDRGLEILERGLLEAGSHSGIAAYVLTEGWRRLERNSPQTLEHLRFGTLTAEFWRAETYMPLPGYRGIHPWDMVIELHQLPIRKEARSLANARGNLEKLARYIDSNNITAEFIIGVTYEKLANATKRFGFNVIEIPNLDEAESVRLRKKFEVFVKSGFVRPDCGEPRLVYQSRKDFLRRFLNPA